MNNPKPNSSIVSLRLPDDQISIVGVMANTINNRLDVFLII